MTYPEMMKMTENLEGIVRDYILDHRHEKKIQEILVIDGIKDLHDGWLEEMREYERSDIDAIMVDWCWNLANVYRLKELRQLLDEEYEKWDISKEVTHSPYPRYDE